MDFKVEVYTRSGRADDGYEVRLTTNGYQWSVCTGSIRIRSKATAERIARVLRTELEADAKADRREIERDVS